jgi:hypothetical protein
MSDINTRIVELIGALGISKNQFAIKIKTSSAMISKVTNQKTNFGKDIIEKIITAYPNLNAAWLITGDGEIWLKNEDKLPVDGTHITAQRFPGSSTRSRLLFKSNERVIKYLGGLEDDLKGLFELIGDFEVFKDGVAKEISEAYFEKLYDIVYDEGIYFDGDRYRLDDCKKDAYNELRKLKDLKPSLTNLNTAILKFYKEFNLVDSKKVIINSIGPHVI